MQRSYGAGEQQDRRRKMSNCSTKVHQPKISRKIRACQECQSRKIRCGIEPGESACARCRKFDLQCVLNKSLQTLLEDECEWKKAMDEKTSQMQFAVLNILQQLDMPPLESLSPRPQSVETNRSPRLATNHSVPTQSQPLLKSKPLARATTPQPMRLDELEGDTLATPMASLFEVIELRNLRAQVSANSQYGDVLAADSISKGKISLQDAEDMFKLFSALLDQYLWCRVALVHENLISVRKSSSLLLAAIIAVTALHTPGKEDLFDAAYEEFLALVCESMFDRRHSLDDIRAFCIGALWLSDVSWKLSGHAVRIAAQLNLHKSVAKAIKGQVEHVERARLWYLLYVCDHQLSIAYGRPHIIQEDTPIWCHEMFLQLPGITQSDWHLHSQVAICNILSRVYRQFGTDTDKALSEADFATLHTFNVEFDTWRAEWEPRLMLIQNGTAHPSRGVFMHWNLARLQINALALRGLSTQQAHLISNQRRDLANLAIAHAVDTFQFILDDDWIRKSILGVELYLHAMITYAAVFLLRVHMRWRPARLNLNIRLTAGLVERSAQLLNQTKTGHRHLTFYIANGLVKLSTKFKELEKIQLDQTLAVTNISTFSQDQWVTANGRSDTVYSDINMYAMDQEYLPGVYD